MQYRQNIEEIVMMSTPYIVVSKPLSLAEVAEVQRTRRILTIILIVLYLVSLSRKQDFVVVVLIQNCLFLILYIKLLGLCGAFDC